MARQRRVRGLGSEPGLDSFMDIVTNVLGAVFVVVIYATLSAGDATQDIRTPVASIADTEPVYFECRGNTVFDPQLDTLLSLSRVALDAIAPGGRFNLDELSSLNDRLRRDATGNAYYSVVPEIRLTGPGGAAEALRHLTPVPDAVGEGETELRSDSSDLADRLGQLDPTEHHVIFLVRDESFEIFHTARRLAIDAGFQVGWEPFAEDEVLVLGPGGQPTPVETGE